MFANSVVVRPVGTREGLVDDCYSRSSFVVGLAQETTALQRHADQVEIGWRYFCGVHQRRLIALIFAAFEDQGEWVQIVSIVAQWNGRYIPNGYFFHAGQRTATTKYFADERRFLSRRFVNVTVRIIWYGQPRAHCHHTLGIESRAHIQQIPKAAQQQAGGNHQHKGQSKFRDHQHAACARLFSRASRASRFLFEHRNQIDPACMQRRSQTENHSGDERGGEGEKQDRPVDGYFVEPRKTVGHDLQQKALGAKKNRQANYPAEQRKKHAFGEQLSYQARPCGSERLANSHFASSCACAREQQIRDVHAADQQDQSHSAKQQNQRLANVADHRLRERHQPHLPCALQRIIVRVFFLQRCYQRV